MSQPGTLYRWGPLAGPVFVVLVVIGFVVGGDSPDTTDPAAKIVAYLAKKSNYDKTIVSFFLVLLAMLFLLCFFAALRTRLAEADPAGRAATLAFGAGTVCTAFFTIALLMFTSAIITAHDKPGHLLNPDIFRLTQDLGYSIWVASAVIGSLITWSTAAVARRTGFLPAWFAWFSIVIGVVALFGIFFFPILIFYVWILVAGIVLYVRPGAAAAPDPAPAAAAT